MRRVLGLAATGVDRVGYTEQVVSLSKHGPDSWQVVFRVVVLCTSAAIFAGCLEQRCGPDLELVQGACLPADSGAAGARDGRGDAADADAAQSDAGDSGAGVACGDTVDCGAAAPLCVTLPGQTQGYCTISDCVPGSGDCPARFVCRDLSALAPGTPPFCVLTCELEALDCPAGFACRDLSLFVAELPPVCFPEGSE